MNTEPDEYIPTRASLLVRLKSWDDQESWKRFFDTYWKLIYSVARKAGLRDAEAQDVVQDTIIAAAKKLPEFKYDPAIGSFKGWLSQLTRRRIIDNLRKKQYERHGEKFRREETLDTAIAERQPDPAAFDLESMWDEEWQKQVMETAMDKAKRQVSAAQFQMFYLHVVKNQPAKDVARHLQAKLHEVYFAKLKVGRIIQKEIKSLANKMI
jgi:RNA polymerase sigma-70 factor (ECF subfamily)